MLKLVRLARIPRLMKLLDVSLFKRTLRMFDSDDPSIGEIVQFDFYIKIYTLMRLVLIQIFMVYGAASLFYLASDEQRG